MAFSLWSYISVASDYAPARATVASDGARVMEVIDPFGNRLRFNEDAARD
jgi:hypothetical protein